MDLIDGIFCTMDKKFDSFAYLPASENLGYLKFGKMVFNGHFECTVASKDVKSGLVYK
jgi:hypothetical protein